MNFVSYAQNFEDVIIWRALKDIQHGFYVDVGAQHPIVDSVSKAFYEQGWRGVHFEPVHQWAELLRRDRPDETVLEVALGERNGTLELFDIPGTGLSTGREVYAQFHQAERGFESRTIRVPCLTLDEALRDIVAGKDIHWLKIDVEGMERAVIRGWTERSIRPWIVVVEATIPTTPQPNYEDWEPLLIERGYRFVYFDGLNRFYLAHEHEELAAAFSAPPNVFDAVELSATANSPWCAGIKRQLAQAEQRAQEAEASARAAEALAAQARGKAEHIGAELRESQRIAQLLQTKLEDGGVAASAAAQLQNQSAELTRLMSMIQASEQLARDAMQQRDAVVNSTSWRISRPLRTVAARIPVSMRQRLRTIVKAAYWIATPWNMGPRMRLRREHKLNEAQERERTAMWAGDALQIASAVTAEYAQWIAECELPGRRSIITEQAALDAGFSVTFLLAVPSVAQASELVMTVNSVRRQTLPRWEVLVGIADDVDSVARNTMKQLVEADERIRCIESKANNKAGILADLIHESSNPFVAILDAGDVLSAHGLNDFAAIVLDDPYADVIYSDEDIMFPGSVRADPYFKPTWSPDLLYGFNYFGRLTLIRRTLITIAGGISADAKAAVEWDLNLRVTSHTEAIRRLPRVLCHRSPNTDKDRPRPGTGNAQAHEHVIKAYWTRQGINAKVETQADGTQRSTWYIAEPPLVSIIIPTKNKSELLQVCVNGIFDRTDYTNWEIVIVDTGSTEPETLALYEKWSANPKVLIVHFNKKFNYSAACNYGASHARGELFLFLNNDIEIVNPDWLTELVRFAMRPGVGVVGTKLRYPNGDLQHAGVVTGMHVCGLVFRGADEKKWGVFGSPSHPRNYLGIMGACQMIRREAFSRVRGFDEAYEIANSDVALCAHVWKAGYRVAYTPFAELVHHEGATRGHSNPEGDMRRTIYDLRCVGVVDDPYFHPSLSGTLSIPTLRLGSDLSARESFEKAAVERHVLHPFSLERELFDDYAAEALTGMPHDALFWPPQRNDKITDKWAAARFCVDLLRSRLDLRQRFPNALSSGAKGSFAQWIAGDGGDSLCLAPFARELILTVLGEDPGKRVRQCYLYRDDLRAAFPLGLLPLGRGAFFQWAVRNGRSEEKLRLEEIWWFFLATAENPAAELIRTYQFTPAWQELYPDAMTVFGRRAFATWFAERHQTSADWVNPLEWPLDLSPAQQIRLAWWTREDWRLEHPDALTNGNAARQFVEWLASEASRQGEDIRQWLQSISLANTVAELHQPGVNIIGHFCYPSGLRTSVETIEAGLRRCGVTTSLRNLRTSERDDPNHAAFVGMELYEATLIHAQPEPFFDSAYARANLCERDPRSYRIGYWYWELEQVPDQWVEKGKQVNELWTATSFVADALKTRFDIPIKTMFPGIQLGKFRKRSLGDFGLALSGKFTFFFAFHMTSIMERKNPLGLIRAFKQAFSGSDEVALVLKTSFGDSHSTKMAELRDAAHGANIEIIDTVLTQDETLSLMDACDAYVSLHRSEGLGLTMGEAMLLGKPVIATRYSGNLEFMDEGNSLLVDYSLKEVGPGNPPYDAHAHWAEPSTEHAAKLMRQLYDNQAWAVEFGAKAKADISRRVSVDEAGIRMRARLEEVSAQLRTSRMAAMTTSCFGINNAEDK